MISSDFRIAEKFNNKVGKAALVTLSAGALALGTAALLSSGVTPLYLLSLYASFGASVYLGNVIGQSAKGEEQAALEHDGKTAQFLSKTFYKHGSSNANFLKAYGASLLATKSIQSASMFIAMRSFPLFALCIGVGISASYFAGLNIGNFERLQRQNKYWDAKAHSISDIDPAWERQQNAQTDMPSLDTVHKLHRVADGAGPHFRP